MWDKVLTHIANGKCKNSEKLARLEKEEKIHKVMGFARVKYLQTIFFGILGMS